MRKPAVKFLCAGAEKSAYERKDGRIFVARGISGYTNRKETLSHSLRFELYYNGIIESDEDQVPDSVLDMIFSFEGHQRSELSQYLKELRRKGEWPHLHEAMEAKSPGGGVPLCYYNRKVAYVTTDGRIEMVEVRFDLIEDILFERLVNICIKCGYPKKASLECGPPKSWVIKQTLMHVGQTIDSLEATIRKQRELADKHDSGKALRDWQEYAKTMTDAILGVDSVDFFPNGFNVWISLNTKYNIKQQAAIVREKQREILKFMWEEIGRKKKSQWKKVVDMRPFCRLSEIAVSQQNLAVFRYEIKDEIAKVLSEGEAEEAI